MIRLDQPLSLSSLLMKNENLASTKLPFVWKLYEMLEDVETTGSQHIVSWVGNGKAFKVHDLSSFVDEIVPVYFKQSKFKSFQRQLYFYEFKRVESGPDTGSYYHPKFVRGIKTLCLTMRPKTNRRVKGRDESKNNSIQEPRASSTEDPPSEWMTKMQNLCVRGAADHIDNENGSNTNVKEDNIFEGEVAFVFGGMPFHYVDVVFSDI